MCEKALFPLRRMAFGGIAALFVLCVFPDKARSETRTLRLHHLHTKEDLDLTYKKDGAYIPSAMAQINYFFRDWRRNKTIAIAPQSIDLIWQIYQDLGSKKPIFVVSGYRSFETNALLRRIGRHVAQESQHSYGRAIDLFFPDVPLEKLRNVALVKERGGVGYYPGRAGGFVHIDTGRVRHWPAISPQKLAGIYKEYGSYREDTDPRNPLKMASLGGGGDPRSSLPEEPRSRVSPNAAPQQPLKGSDVEPAEQRMSIPLPQEKPVLMLAAPAPSDQKDQTGKVPMPEVKPEQILAMSRVALAPVLPQPKPVIPASYEITPVSHPIQKPNFSQEKADLMTTMTLAVLAQSQNAYEAPVPNTLSKGKLARTISPSDNGGAPLQTATLSSPPHSTTGEGQRDEKPLMTLVVNRALKGDLQ